MRRIFGVLVLILMTVFAEAQGIDLSDSTITFRDAAGQTLSPKEAAAFMQQGKFSMQTESAPGGRKIVTLLRADEAEGKKSALAEYAWAFRLRGKAFKAPSATDLKGAHWNASTLTGKITVVNFWFTQCKPCIAEMPDLNHLAAEQPGVVFLAPTFDEAATVKRFLERFPFHFNIVAGQRSYIEALGVPIFPTTLVIDKRGIVRDVFTASDPLLVDKLRQAIGALSSGK